MEALASSYIATSRIVTRRVSTSSQFALRRIHPVSALVRSSGVRDDYHHGQLHLVAALERQPARRLERVPVATTGVDLTESDEEAGSLSQFLTSERAKVVVMVALAMALCNADRVVMSVAIVPMSAAHSWTQSFAGVVQSSFLWGYLLSPIAGGALADRHGAKDLFPL